MPTSCSACRRLIVAGARRCSSEWCIADADFALMLMRLVANGDPRARSGSVDYAPRTWGRHSVRKYLRTSRPLVR